MNVERDGIAAEEVSKRRLIEAGLRQLSGESGLRDDQGSGLADGAKPPHVVPVSVRENDVFDGRSRDLAQLDHRVPGGPLGRSRVDGDDEGIGHDEREVCEVVALGDVDSVRLAYEFLLRESESVRAVDRNVPQDL